MQGRATCLRSWPDPQSLITTLHPDNHSKFHVCPVFSKLHETGNTLLCKQASC